MKKRFWILATIISAAVAQCSVAVAPRTLPVETGSVKIIAYEKGSATQRWESTLTTIKTNFDGKPYYYTEDNGKGRFGNDNAYKTWKVKGYYQIGTSALIPYEVKMEMKDSSGKKVFTLDKSYNYDAKKIVCNVNGSVKTYALNANTLDKDILGRVLSNFPFDTGSNVNFHLFTHEPALYYITMKYRGQETITVKNRDVLCHKLELVPDLGALNLIGAFVPKTYFWFTAAKPHRFMRYEGLESGLGTPIIVMETAD